jgi:hypothetical protein
MALSEQSVVNCLCASELKSSDGDEIQCLKCIELKSELLKLRNELKSLQFIVQLPRDESDNRLATQEIAYNLTNGVEEELKQKHLPSVGYSGEWKQVLNKQRLNNLDNKKALIFNQQRISVVTTSNRYEQLSHKQDRKKEGKIREPSRCKRRPTESNRILIIGDSHVRGCSEKLTNSLGNTYRVTGITKPNANASAILNDMNLKDEDLLKRDVVIFCGGSRDIAKNESTQGLRSIVKFVRRLVNTNVIIMTAPHRHDLQASSCVNTEVETFNRKLRKQLSPYDYVWVCSSPKDREYYTQHGLHLNSKGKIYLISKWVPLIQAMTIKTRNIGNTRPIPLPWSVGEVTCMAHQGIVNTLPPKSFKVVARNNKAFKIKLVMALKSTQDDVDEDKKTDSEHPVPVKDRAVNDDNKKTDSAYSVLYKDRVVKMASSVDECVSILGTNDQDGGKAKSEDVEVEGGKSVIGKDLLSNDKVDVEVKDDDEDKVKLVDVNDVALRRSTRTKNMKVAKPDDFLWEN